MSQSKTNRVAFMTYNDGVEQVELTEPRKALTAAGIETALIAPAPGTVKGRFNDMDPGDDFTVDVVLSDATAEDYDGLVLPGGAVGPDMLRTFPQAVDLIQRFLEKGKFVAAICHGAVPLAEADVLEGRTLTSVRNIHTDLVNAGATWIDQELVVDDSAHGTIITSRGPHDLEVFSAELVRQVKG
jgi:protease I